MERTRRQLAYRHKPEEEQSPVTVPPQVGEIGTTLEPVPDANVQVISGASVQTLALAGLQVAQARRLVGTVLGIDPQARVLVNGQPVRSDYRLAGGDTLEFVHHAGEKGGECGALH